MALMRSEGIPSLVLGRTVFVLLGVLWAVRSLQSFTDPNFIDPAGASDWLAVVGVSLGLALLPVGLVLLLGLSRCGGRISGVLLVIAALGAVVRRQVNRVRVDGHRGDSFSRAFAGLLKDHAVAVLISERHAHVGPVVHHIPGLNCLPLQTHRAHSLEGGDQAQ